MATFIASLFVGTAATGTVAATGALLTGAAATAAAAAGTLSAFTAGSAGLFGFGGAVTAAGFLQGAFGLVSAFSSFQSGQEQQNIENLDAELAELEGLEKANAINRAALEQEAINNAATRSAGLTLTGSGSRIEEELQFDANRNLRVVRRADLRAGRFRIRGRQAARRGVAKGAGTLLKLFS